MGYMIIELPYMHTSICLYLYKLYIRRIDEIKGIDPNWPVVEDPSAYTYIRPEGNGLMVGLFEGVAAGK